MDENESIYNSIKHEKIYGLESKLRENKMMLMEVRNKKSDVNH